MTISKEMLDALLCGLERPKVMLGDKALMREPKVRLMERKPGAEVTWHSGDAPHGKPTSGQTNRRNDTAASIYIPRDRDGSSEPELIQKGQTRITTLSNVSR